MTATTDACVTIGAVNATTVTLSDPNGVWLDVELTRTAGSVLSPALTSGSVAGVRLSAEIGPMGAFSLQPISVAGC